MERPDQTDKAQRAALRIAEGELPTDELLAELDPALAERLVRVARIGRALLPAVPTGASWGHLVGLQRAGSGSFGEVFRAWDPTLDREVALKLRRADEGQGLPSGREFVAEARRHARVRHPNVLAIHGAGYHDGKAGLWADWIEGEVLSRRIERRPGLSLDQVLAIAESLASALQAVHEAGIVHGDVKASNVMLDQRGHAILMDFGAGFRSEEQRHLPAAGTPGYLAPEALSPSSTTPAALGPALDLYALGVLIHRMACASYPGPGAALDRGVPAALRPLLRALLSADPAQRPDAASAGAWLRRLREAPMRRARWRLRAALVAALVAVAGMALWGYVGAEQERARTQVALEDAEAVNRFLNQLLSRASPEALGPGATLAELLAVAPDLLAEQASLAPRFRARVLAELGRLQADLSDETRSAAMFRAAQALLPPGEQADLMASWAIRMQASTAVDAALREEAQMLLRRAQQVGSPALQAEAEAALAEVLFRDSLVRRAPVALQSAQSLLRQALARPGALAPVSAIHVHRRAAVLALELGVKGEAESHARQALALAVSLGGEAHPQAAASRRVLGWALLEQGRARQAEQLFRDNLGQHAKAERSISRQLADDLLGLAFALNASEQSAAALPFARQAFEVASKVYPPGQRTLIDAGLIYGSTLRDAGHPADALVQLGSVQQALRAARGADNRQHVLIDRELMATHAALGDAQGFASARASCIEHGRRALGADSAIVAECVAQAPP